MYTVDIHSNKETKDVALSKLLTAISFAKRDKDKILCLIVGYGSRGGTHKIKSAVIEKLDDLIKEKRIKAYLLGEDLNYGSKHIEFLKVTPLFSNVKKESNKGVIFVSV